MALCSGNEEDEELGREREPVQLVADVGDSDTDRTGVAKDFQKMLQDTGTMTSGNNTLLDTDNQIEFDILQSAIPLDPVTYKNEQEI